MDAKRVKENRSAWASAREHGVDMSLIETNLRKTPAERIRAHCRALATAKKLREGTEKRSDGSKIQHPPSSI